MKSLTSYIGGLLLLGVFFLASCEGDFEKINTNQDQSLDAATPALLSQAIRDFAYNDYDVWYGGRQSYVAAQMWAQRNYTSEDRYSFRTGTMDGYFRNNYIWMNNLQEIIRLNTDPATKAKMAALYGDNAMQIATANVMKAWVFQLLTDSFGSIPFSQALDYLNYPAPKYDTQKEVYDGLIAMLKTAVDDLQGKDGFSTGDLFYKGDTDKWILLANSIRLRLALRASNVDASYLTEAQDAINDGVFSSNADNAQVEFSSVGAPNEAPVYNGFYVNNRNDFTMTRQFVELLKGNNDANKGFVNPFNGLVDPRWAVYRGPYYAALPDRNGMPYGMPDSYTKAYRTKLLSYSYAIPLKDAAVMLRQNFPSTFLDYPTVCFMKCEVAGWDATLFQAGVEASLKMWGAEDAAYVSSIMTKFNDPATTVEMKKEMVITQKYIHLYTQPYEAWAEYRRTGYPKSIVKPGETTAVIGGVPVIFTPVAGKESGSDIVARFMYPTSEYTLNKTNVEAAVASMGADDHKHRVWWAGGGIQ